MTYKTPPPLVPKLRFPEFHDAGEWVSQPLKNVAEPISEKVGKTKCVPMSVTTGVGLVSQEDKFGRVIAGDSYKNYIKLQTDDFAYNKSATKEFPQGYIARYTGTRPAGVPNSIFTCFRPDTDSVVPQFLDLLFHGNHHGRWLRKYITVGARAHGALSVSDDDLFSMPVPVPPEAVSRAEQLKIAECLGSLDDLIVAEVRKREALRRHKQALMQHLFPQSGETVPRLRFPEFKRARAWDAHKVGDVVTILKGKGIAKADLVEDGAIPCIHYGELYTVYAESISSVRSRTNVSVDNLLLSEAGDVIIPASGETKEDIATCACVMEQGVALGSDLNVLRSDINGRFFSYYLNGSKRAELAKVAQGDTVAHLYPTQIAQLGINVPSDPAEQDRIADCLAVLDACLSSQQVKSDTLRTHKQALLQQLFPSLA